MLAYFSNDLLISINFLNIPFTGIIINVNHIVNYFDLKLRPEIFNDRCK